MAFFQSSVLNKYLKAQDSNLIKAAFDKYSLYFHNPAIQQNILNAKEEQFQEGFLRELFVNVLGYTLNPNPNYNLTTEQKNEKGSKKADGAILLDGKPIAVIELKGTDTTDLDKINVQAFNYKNNHSNCIYVITSNFEKLRFFINDSVDHLEFSLFNLNQDQFSLLWLCLHKDNFFKGIPLKIKEESLVEDEKITNKLYKDYSSFRTDLWQSMVKNNTKTDQLLLFKKTQKLLDRFLFIFFAEDSGLLPPNSISRILQRWQTLKDEDAYKPLYDIFKQYFGYIHTGRSGKNSSEDIFAYNGGLFIPDEVLDHVIIDDLVLHKHVTALSKYYFESEVDVNILGHIFENSLNEIESIAASIEGQELDKSRSKRKKDGVFYTPKYITKYIIDNTVGQLCQDKKNKLGIIDDEFAKTRKYRKKETIKKLDEQLKSYRNWLLQITICDPACGSGAFLNQALEFLIQEHAYIDELYAKLFGLSIVFQDVSNQIIEKNLFGVDINEESVEIAKLSLWLRTAKKGRKLTSLNENIKCGNSLVTDPLVAGDKAFDWRKEFPSVFEKGGFDVIIGNPPYVRAELLVAYTDYFSQRFQVYDPASDLFSYFYELGTTLISSSGIMGYISNTFDKTTAGKALREYLLKNTSLEKYIDFTEVQVFEGATTYPVIIILTTKKGVETAFNFIKIPKNKQSKAIEIDREKVVPVIQNLLSSEVWSFLPEEKYTILNKLEKFKKIKDTYGKCYRGIITGLNEAFILPSEWQSNDHIKSIYEGKEIKKWTTPIPEQKLIVFESKWTKQKYGKAISEEEAFAKMKKDYPEIMTHLNKYKDNAKKRFDKGEFWWELRNCAYYELFSIAKIIFPNLQNQNKFSLDSTGAFINAPAVFLPIDSKSLLCILNSKVVWFFLKSICVVRSGGYIEVKPQYFEQIPIPDLNTVDTLESKSDTVISKTADLQETLTNFTDLLQSKVEINNLTKSLENWYKLDFKDFLKELKKVKVKLDLSEEAKWMKYFNTEKQKAVRLKLEIEKIEKEINDIVYKLYDLTSEEIEIIEKS